MILREIQNQNDADDANDAESGIWYRDILKTASRASSASLSSRKDAAGVWGTPQKCVCGYPNAMLAKHVPAQSGVIKADPHTNSYMLQSESTVIHPKILTRKSESVLIHFGIYVRYIANAKFICVQLPPTPRHGLWWVRKDG